MIRACLLSSLVCAFAAAGASTSCAAGDEVCSAAEEVGQPAAAMLQARINSFSSSVNTGSNAVLDTDEKDVAESARGEAVAEAAAAVAEAAENAQAEAASRMKVAQQAAAYLKIKERRVEYQAHISDLEKAMAAVNASTAPSEMELQNMMQHFSDNQAASQDKCPALLLEAKHQLNVVHEHIHELAIEINITEQSLVSEHTQIETTYEMINNTHAWKVEEALKCKAKREENWKMYWILKAELLEMHQIANPSFQANYDYSAWALKHDFSAKTHTIVSTSSYAASSTSTGSHSNTGTTGITSGFGDQFTAASSSSHSSTYSTGFINGGSSYSTTGFMNQGTSSGFMSGYTGLAQKGNTAYSSAQKEAAPKPASLLQAAAEAEAEDDPANANAARDPARVAKARAMVQQTKKLASELSACMAEAKKSPEATAKASLLEETALPNHELGATNTALSSSSGPYSLEQKQLPVQDNFGWSHSNSHSWSHSSNSGGITSGGMFSSASTGVYTGYGYGYQGQTSYSTGHSSASSTSTGQTYHSQSTYHSSFKVSHSASHSSLSKYTTSTTGTWGSSEECQWQKQSLQVVYIRAYIELTRLLAQYEVIIHEHTCDDWVLETEGSQEKILEAKMVKMTTTVVSFQHKLESYHTRLTAAYRLEVRLRSHISILVTNCGEMDATVSSLDKVRDAIMVMGVCPGLGRLTFNIPKWTGQILDGTFDTLTMTDAQVDAAMNQLCASNPPTVAWANLLETGTSPPSPVKISYVFRAAETSEIMLRSIEDIPTTNTASIPIMGPCPNCDGDEDVSDGPQHASGHFRVCWDPEAALSATTKREDCTAGRKAVLCVAEQTYNENATVIGR